MEEEKGEGTKSTVEVCTGFIQLMGLPDGHTVSHSVDLSGGSQTDGQTDCQLDRQTDSQLDGQFQFSQHVAALGPSQIHPPKVVPDHGRIPLVHLLINLLPQAI